MKRRKWLTSTGLATAGMVLHPSLSQWLGAYSHHTLANGYTPSLTIQQDGSFDLRFGAKSVVNAYPGIDKNALRASQVQVGKNKIVYYTPDYVLELRFELSDTRVRIATKISSNTSATSPHRVHPIWEGSIQGASALMYQGLGFGGPSGVAQLSEPPYLTPKKTEEGRNENWVLESYLMSAMLTTAQSAQVAVAVCDHNHYLFKTTLSSKQSHWGLINRHLLDERHLLSLEFGTEHTSLPTDGIELPEVYFEAAGSAMEACTLLAKEIAKVMKVPALHPPSYHWCSWYIRERETSLKDLELVIDKLQKSGLRQAVGTLQIDDGYETHYGDWLDIRTALWPGGMKAAIEKITRNGYRAGIWIGAFMVHKQSKLYKLLPDWILKRRDGSFIEEFGGDCVVLDSSHPEAMAYIKQVLSYFYSIGVRFYKTDFMDWGLQDSVLVQRYTPGKTSVQYYREVLQAIRACIGEESYWLACISPFPPFLGYANGVRSANDTVKYWNTNNISNMVENMVAQHYANQILWHNDPDVMYLGTRDTQLTEDEIRTIAYFIGILGSSVNTSDWLEEPSNVRLFKFIKPHLSNQRAELWQWGAPGKAITVYRHYPVYNGLGLLVFNPTLDALDVEIDFEAVAQSYGKVQKLYYWSHLGAEPMDTGLKHKFALSKHRSLLVYLSLDGKAPSPKLTLGGYVWK